MNQRIKELNLQAMSIVMNGSDPDGDVDRMYIPSEFTKKFAELIVRECAGLINHRADTCGDWLDSIKANKFVKAEQRECAKLIKEHFGVEE